MDKVTRRSIPTLTSLNSHMATRSSAQQEAQLSQRKVCIYRRSIARHKRHFKMLNCLGVHINCCQCWNNTKWI